MHSRIGVLRSRCLEVYGRDQLRDAYGSCDRHQLAALFDAARPGDARLIGVIRRTVSGEVSTGLPLRR